ncbi:unnamed protein product [Phytophthora fragariaefolia]|uniref:Unnamed protein product n=1 Tax=Phytophthora fragariaefolia TaxID=1490495 RepID=A0A9W6X1L5_9STRA|nr:unnamed protein product [Phytophthora fragariaefolia]
MSALPRPGFPTPSEAVKISVFTGIFSLWLLPSDQTELPSSPRGHWESKARLPSSVGCDLYYLRTRSDQTFISEQTSELVYSDQKAVASYPNP